MKWRVVSGKRHPSECSTLRQALKVARIGKIIQVFFDGEWRTYYGPRFVPIEESDVFEPDVFDDARCKDPLGEEIEGEEL